MHNKEKQAMWIIHNTKKMNNCSCSVCSRRNQKTYH